MASTIICKLSFGDETRRFKVEIDNITYQSIHNRAEALFGFAPTTKFKLQYKDDEEDVITMATDEEMLEAVGLAVASTPPILRVSVKLDAATQADSAPATKTTATTNTAEAPAADAVAGEAADAPGERPVDLAAVLKDIKEQLPKFASSVGAVPADGKAPDFSALLGNIGEALPKFVDSLPESLRKQMGNAELDVAATLASNAASNLASALGGSQQHGTKGPGVSFSVLPPCAAAAGFGYGDKGVHPGVTCDKSGMSPIVGPRYNLKGHNYDLCEAEFSKLEPSEQAKFVKIDPPHGGGADLPKRGWAPQMVHPGVTCDKSGMSPIVGPRYNLKGHNYDLCEAEFNKLEPSEQAKFVKIEAPWRPKGCHWGRGWGGPNGMGGGGGHCHGGANGMGGGGHCHGGGKLAARFVSDVSIFDGTQMAPGTPFTKIWRLKNSGEMPWPAGSKLLFVGGDRMAAEFTVPCLSEANKVVMPGEEVDVAVDMVAPTELGRYLGYWRLVGPLGRKRFGQRVWCHIQVVDPAGADTPHDPTAVEAEISSLMAKAQKDDPDVDDADAEAPPAAAAEAEPVAAPKAEEPAAASSSSSCSSIASSSAASLVEMPEEAADEEAAAKEKAAKQAADKERAAEEAAAKEKAAKEKAAKESAAKETAAAKAAKAAAKEAVEVAPPAAAEDADLKSEADVSTQLLTMGFESKVVELVMEKNGGVYPLPNMLESCTCDLVQLSEWDSMLSDLEEMGFADREKNTRLMMKNDGSVKRTVKDLVSM